MIRIIRFSDARFLYCTDHFPDYYILQKFHLTLKQFNLTLTSLQPRQAGTTEEEEQPIHKRRRINSKRSDLNFPFTRRSQLAGRFFGLTSKEWRCLKHQRAPTLLWQLLWYITAVMKHNIVERSITCIEYYSGVGNIARAFNEAGERALTFEREDNCELQDFLLPQGMLTATVYALMLEEGGLAHWGTVCSSWVWIARHTTGRDINIKGNLDRKPVQEGNIMVARMVLLLLLLQARRCTWLLEQPGTSIMHKYPRFPLVGPFFETRTSMGCFGAKTLKPTALRSNMEWVQRLARTANKNVRERCSQNPTVSRNTCGSVTGMRKQLKDTQE